MFDLRPDWRDASSPDHVRLVMIGSVRDASDEARVEGLKKLAEELGVLVSPQLTSVGRVASNPVPTLLPYPINRNTSSLS
jgi:hypothetical protein